jgi:GNAT superfamily N-acetyltransferase
MTASTAPLAVPSPDETLETLAAGAVRARCSLWWRETPLHGARRTGFIGAVASSDDAALEALLARAAERLRREGCALAVGPVDGNTWHRYRLVTWTDGTPLFPLEPHSPLAATVPWERAGFTPLESYSSLRDDALGERDARVPALAEKLCANGVTLRALDLKRFDEELAQIHSLALRGFRDAPLFTPIGFEEFASLYRPLVPLLDARLCPLAEIDGRIGAVLFAFRDPRAPETVVLKTVVRDADRRLAGVGFVLTDAARAAAHALGATRAISALQHDGTLARSLAERAVIFRRYAVFSKELS